MKTILVTGGSGFIGSHLCGFLLEQKNRVICVDSFFTGVKSNIEPLLINPDFKLVEHDIIDPLYIDEKIDQIYNLACPASPVHYQKNAIRTIKANTIGVINILGLARAKQAVVLQASTSEIYGDPLVHPQTEDYRGNVNPIGPRACYDEGKRCAETLCFDYHRTWGIKIKVARIFNTYGPRMSADDGRVVSNFVTQALAGGDLTVYGNGSQTRSFCYVDDMVDGLVKLANSADSVFGPINLGNPEEFTVEQLAKKVLAMTGSSSKIVFRKLPEDDPTRRRPDISKAIELLHWQPSIKLEEGLKKTIEYFKSQI